VIGLVFSGQSGTQVSPAALVWLSQLVSRSGVTTSIFSALPAFIQCTVTNAFNFGHNSVIKIFASRIQEYFVHQLINAQIKTNRSNFKLGVSFVLN